MEEVWDVHITRVYWWLRATKVECDYSLYDFQQHFEQVRLKKAVKVPRSVVWCRPVESLLKFNVDGAARGGSREWVVLEGSFGIGMVW